MVSGIRYIHHLEGPEGLRGLQIGEALGPLVVEVTRVTTEYVHQIWDHQYGDHHMESTDMESMEV